MPGGVAVTMSDLASHPSQAFSYPPPSADPAASLLLMGPQSDPQHPITTTTAPHSARLPSDSGFSMLPSGYHITILYLCCHTVSLHLILMSHVTHCNETCDRTRSVAFKHLPCSLGPVNSVTELHRMEMFKHN